MELGQFHTDIKPDLEINEYVRYVRRFSAIVFDMYSFSMTNIQK